MLLGGEFVEQETFKDSLRLSIVFGSVGQSVLGMGFDLREGSFDAGADMIADLLFPACPSQGSVTIDGVVPEKQQRIVAFLHAFGEGFEFGALMA